MQAALARRAVERARLREHGVAIDKSPGAYHFVALGNALEARRRERFGGELSGFDAPRCLSGRQFVQSHGWKRSIHAWTATTS